MHDEFAKKSPPTVLVQATMAHALSSERVNALFEATAEAQYTRELAFSTLIDLMAPVVGGMHPSVHAAYQKNKEEIGASVAAVCEKLQGIEPEVCEALVRDVSCRLAQVIDAMPGGKRKPLLPGYQVRILDGNYIAASEHRIAELRETSAGPLPGKSLVVLDPERMLGSDIFLCEDGHAQERSLLDQVLERVRERELWISDRNFCRQGFLSGINRQKSYFIIRLHSGLRYEESAPWREIGPTATGARSARTGVPGFVMERKITIDDGEGDKLALRLVRLNLSTPTRDGEDVLYLLTNLSESTADAIKVTELYRNRWLLETAFYHLKKSLNCEINPRAPGLGYPKAALFAFSVSLLAYNIFSVTRAALRAKWGEKAGDEDVSMYCMTEEISAVHRGMMIVLSSEAWDRYAKATPEQLAAELLALAGKINLKQYRKHPRGPKKPANPRASDPKHPHVSTKKLLDTRGKRLRRNRRERRHLERAGR
ncbi:MAG: transposase [Planctomycetota bacterium]